MLYSPRRPRGCFSLAANRGSPLNSVQIETVSFKALV